MNVAELVQSYGYLAIALGSFLEGESVLLVGGAAAHRGYLLLPVVVGIAAVAGFIGDQLYFHVGRRYGDAVLERFPSIRPRAQRAKAMLARHHMPLILAIRFLYGLRIAGPIAIGMTDVPAVRFAMLNLIGAVVWATLFVGLGYGFGQALALLPEEFDRDELWLLAIVLGAAAIGVILRRWQSMRRRGAAGNSRQ